jgi:hypothetical protein
MNLDVVFLVMGIVLMAGAIGVKIVTNHLLHRMRQHTASVQAQAKQTLCVLRQVLHQKRAAESERRALGHVKAKLKRKMGTVHKELGEHLAESERRQKLSEDMRSKLMHPLGAP